MVKKKAFIFPGQGAQKPFMGKSFYDTYVEAKEIYQLSEEVLKMHIAKKIFSSDEESLKRTDFCQIALFVTSIAILKVLESQNPEIKPSVTSGLSLGEYASLVASKKGTFEDLLKVISLRGRYMDEATMDIAQAMVAVIGLKEEAIPKKYQIANINTPGQIVLGGSKMDLKDVESDLKAIGAKRVIPLNVSGAFHTSYMEKAKEKLAPAIWMCPLIDSNIVCIMNLTGKGETKVDSIKQHLIDQMTQRTRWLDCVYTMEGLNVDYIEIGPAQLSTMNKKMGLKGETFCIQEVKDMENLFETV